VRWWWIAVGVLACRESLTVVSPIDAATPEASKPDVCSGPFCDIPDASNSSCTNLCMDQITCDSGVVETYTFHTPLDAGPYPTCGKVTFVDMHVAPGSTPGDFPSGCATSPLLAQQRVLEFMLLSDIPICDVYPPPPPP